MYLFAFRSRTQSMKLYDTLTLSGIKCEIINTPRQVSTSCGLSVRVPDSEGERAMAVFDYYNPDTLIGIFYCDQRGCRRYR